MGGLTQLGRFEIICPLAKGGMAALYLARAAGIGGFERLFAIKLIHEHLSRDERFVQMFLDEARLAARIRHTNVVPVYEVGIHADRHFLVMEYLSGETLGAALSSTWPKGLPFPPTLVPLVIASAAEGLHAAHELRDVNGASLGVIHRDVTPQNIMLGDDGAVRVMDFGVARALDQLSESLPGSFKGTPAYMAPEQVLSGDIDRRADIFALGIILWEMTVGKRLFKAKSDVATTMNVLQREIVAPSTIYPGYPAELEAIVMKALDRNRERRFATARDLAEALQSYEMSLGSRAGAGDLERWMSNTFAVRITERRRLEKVALDPKLTTSVQLPIQLASASSGLPSLTPAPIRLDLSDDSEVTALSTVEVGLGTPPPVVSAPKRRVAWTIGAMVLLGSAILGGKLLTWDPDPNTPPAAASPQPMVAPATPKEVSPQPSEGQAVGAQAPLPDPPPASEAVAPASSTAGNLRVKDGPQERRRGRRPRPKSTLERSWQESDDIYQGSDL